MRGKPFDTVLVYLDRILPALDAYEHGRFAAEAARLLGDAPARQRMADAVFEAFRARPGSDAAAERTGRVLRRFPAEGHHVA